MKCMSLVLIIGLLTLLCAGCGSDGASGFKASVSSGGVVRQIAVSESKRTYFTSKSDLKELDMLYLLLNAEFAESHAQIIETIDKQFKETGDYVALEKAIGDFIANYLDGQFTVEDYRVTSVVYKIADQEWRLSTSFGAKQYLTEENDKEHGQRLEWIFRGKKGLSMKDLREAIGSSRGSLFNTERSLGDYIALHFDGRLEYDAPMPPPPPPPTVQQINEGSASAALKSAIFEAQVQFQAGGFNDADNNGIGRFGFIDEMSGHRAVTGADVGHLALILGPLCA